MTVVVDLVTEREDLTWLPLTGSMSDDDFASLIAVFDADEFELTALTGGVRWHDTVTGSTVLPGCCAYVAYWRDALSGTETPWLGHSPDVRIEHHPGFLRVHQDTDPARGYVDVPRDELPALRAGILADLQTLIDRLVDSGHSLYASLAGRDLAGRTSHD